MRLRAPLLGVLLLIGSLVTACGTNATAKNPFGKINHIIVLYQENWSFDSLYGKFPGANGIADATPAELAQVDKNGTPLTVLPQPLLSGKPDPRFPANLPVKPFDATQYVPADMMTGDLVHRYYQEQYQIDGGKMDKFVTWSDAAGLVMSYYDATNLPEGKLAQQYTMADNFFHSSFGGSFLNHQWLVCACTPTFPNAPVSAVAQLDSNGVLKTDPATGKLLDGFVTPDGHAVNTSFTVNTPHPATAKTAQLVPNQTAPTIGDRLSDKNVSWAWYSGGWNDALAGHPDKLFQYHHQPFAYYQNYADGTKAKSDHLKDETDFTAALKNGTLPAVSFVKPLGEENEHPGYASLAEGQQHIADIVSAVQHSPYWQDTAIVITYDENGGRWDHVAPPKIDQWGPGARVPGIIISPFAAMRKVDHTQYETISILRTIEVRWGLKPLNTRDSAVNDLRNALPGAAK